VLSNGEKIPPADMEMAIALDPLVDQVMVVGEGKPYLGALVVLNADLWSGLAAEYEIDPAGEESLRDGRLEAELLKRIRGQLKDFPGYAKIRRVALLLEPWTIDNDLLTPTMKVKRQRVLEYCKTAYDSLYDDGLV
jgi:long-chain acyl-CoA synthetase